MIILHNSDDNDNINSNNNMPYRHYIYIYVFNTIWSTKLEMLPPQCIWNTFGTHGDDNFKPWELRMSWL